MNNMLNEKQFLEVVKYTPLVSIDLILEDRKGRVLLGKRLNRPAQGYWFVPGGIIRKNEKIADAIERISAAELGTAIPISDAQLLGTYDHIYDDNLFGVDGINTHYVVLAYRVNIQEGMKIVRDSQHSEIEWWSKHNLLYSPDVHDNTKAYFTCT